METRRGVPCSCPAFQPHYQSSDVGVGYRRPLAFAQLVLRGWFGSVILGVGRRPFLLSPQLLVVSGLFSAVTLGTLKAIIRFAHKQSPDDFRCSPTPKPQPGISREALRPGAFRQRPPQLSRSSSISNPRARAVCASPCETGEPPRPFRVLVAPMASRTSGAASSRETCPRAAS